MRRVATVLLAVVCACSGGSEKTARPTTTSRATTTTVPTTTVPPEPVVVLDVSGTNDTATEDFTVTDTWTITAEITGGAGTNVRVMKHGSDIPVDFITFASETGGGTSQARVGGTFYLDISTFGTTWRVVVTDVPG